MSDIAAHWQRHPPMRDLVEMIATVFCGYKPPKPPAKRSCDPNDPSGIGELLRANPSGVIRG